MTDTSAIDQRLMELEIKASYTEDLLDKLDQVVVRQQAQIDTLTREVIALRQQTYTSSDNVARSVQDELPPHY
jgi:SlyX protein